MNAVQDRVNKINTRTARRTDAIISAHLAGHITRAEREQTLAIDRAVASIEVRKARQDTA